MFRVWGKIIQNNHLLQDTVVEISDKDMSRTHKVYKALNRTRKVYYCLEEICNTFDLGKPIWLDQNKKEFLKVSKTRFNKDSFIESIDFDYLEFQVIEEDNFWD